VIVVSPRSRLAETVARYRPVRAVSLRSPGVEAFDGFTLPEACVLDLAFNDIAEARPGLVAADEAHVQALIDFARGWDREGPLLIHCYAGISRSTASALAVAAALAPERDAAELAATLRRLSPEATPNPLVVRLADDLLSREGRLVEAVRRIGRGAEAFEGRPFALALDAGFDRRPAH
jgi:predicted protein tyrosine phosphatase